jgi:hypothetical protein
VAVSIAVSAVETPETVAEKPALDEPAGTVTVEGTATADWLLARFTVNPPLAAAALRVTVQGSVPEPLMDPSVHERPFRTGMPVPLRLTALEDEESLAIVSCPDTAPATEGSNWTVKVVEEPGLKVKGSLGAETENPVPEVAAEVMVTAAAPVELTFTVCVTGVLTLTLPKVKLVALRVSEGFATSTSTSVVSDTPPALAVRTTLCGELTEEAVAWKLPLVAPASTVIDAGTEIAALLLARLICIPPLPAAALRLTEQESVPNSGIALLLHVNAFNTGPAVKPIPLNPTTEVAPVVALVVIVSCPLAAPATEGSKDTLREYVPPAGATEMGTLFCAFAVNPLPVTLMAEISIAEELRLTSKTFAVAVVPTETEPKLREPGDISSPLVEVVPVIEVPPQPESPRASQGKRNSRDP